jgi:FkbM family methyltransferase
MSSFNHYFKEVSKRAGVYHRLQASWVYDLYWSVVDERWVKYRKMEVDFYRSLLEGFRPNDLIFDVGANHGSKTDIYLRLGANVVAVEPDELSQEILREKFLRYRLSPKPVVIVGKALSDRSATETMWVDGPGSAFNSLSQKWVQTLRQDKARFQYTHSAFDFSQSKIVETTTLEQLIARYGLPFFVKIDVEGNEACALQGLKRPIPYLSFEVNLPEFKTEGKECVKLLEELTAEGKFNYSPDCKGGLVLKEWVHARELLPVFERCTEKSIEVFWRAWSPLGQEVFP